MSVNILEIIKSDDIECMRKNINEIKLNSEKREENGKTLLHILVQDVVSEHLKEMIRLLLENKANPNSKDNEGNTPMHLYCQHARIDMDILNMLCEYKADPNILNAGDKERDNLYQNSPFHFLCDNINASPAMVRLLLEYGANPSVVNTNGGKEKINASFIEIDDIYGMTPVDYAKNNKSLQND